MRKTVTGPLTVVASVAVVGLVLAGCGAQEPAAEVTENPSTTQSSSNGAATVDQNALLSTNEQLAQELGAAYVQGWIQDGQLNVSVTSDDALKTVEDAGAVGHLTQFSSDELREGISQIMAWQATQPTQLRTSIHAYTLNPSTGGITLAVDPAQRDAVETALAEDKPAGQIPLDFTDSAGPATPAPATVGTPSG